MAKDLRKFSNENGHEVSENPDTNRKLWTKCRSKVRIEAGSQKGTRSAIKAMKGRKAVDEDEAEVDADDV